MSQPKVRLADADTPLAELYNFYQLSSMAASFYLKAADCESLVSNKVLWQKSSFGCLDQVALSHKWYVQGEAWKQKGLTPIIYPKLALRSRSLAGRCIVAERYLNDWAFSDRWIRFADKMEFHVASFVSQLAAAYPFVAEDQSHFLNQQKQRRETLKTILGLWLAEKQSLEGSYALPVAL